MPYLLVLTKQFHYLETKHSSIWPYSGHCHSNHHTFSKSSFNLFEKDITCFSVSSLLTRSMQVRVETEAIIESCDGFGTHIRFIASTEQFCPSLICINYSHLPTCKLCISDIHVTLRICMEMLGETAQCWRVLPALSEDQISVPSTHVMAHRRLGQAHGTLNVFKQNTHIHKIE